MVADREIEIQMERLREMVEESTEIVNNHQRKMDDLETGLIRLHTEQAVYSTVRAQEYAADVNARIEAATDELTALERTNLSVHRQIIRVAGTMLAELKREYEEAN